MKRNSFLMNISSWDHGRQLQCAITVRHSAFKYNFKLHTCTTADSSYIDSLVSQTSARQQIWSTFAVSHHLVYKGVQWCTLVYRWTVGESAGTLQRLEAGMTISIIIMIRWWVVLKSCIDHVVVIQSDCGMGWANECFQGRRDRKDYKERSNFHWGTKWIFGYI